ncbi:hypothetical protein [Chitinophaga arvensicola]|uniref:Uncharacterized protein n=1 Tax=Chitinophaga arvensicola TaxID=29529 RepID=A0A1I0S9F4_9BACT|nr:hypothetical protein [Chitinophaga arvensicola]SEW52856.1 hypothetical protein SAMN04488122_5182 [Chitinophaga arvensicola]
MKGYALVVFLLVSCSGFAQNTINNYKYVLVPERFSFARENDQYGLNSVAKSLLDEKGFTTYFDNSEIPTEVAGNRCNALITEVVQKKGLFVTNLTVILKDCKGNVIFKSKEGKSREKEFATSYNLALRDAFTSLNDVPYAYVPAPQQAAPAVQAGVVPTSPVVTPAATAPAAPVATTPVVAEVKEAAGTLYAQATANGYQLIDTSPKIVLTLLKASVADYFIANNGASHGIVLKKNGDWYFEYYKDNKLISEKLLIKF